MDFLTDIYHMIMIDDAIHLIHTKLYLTIKIMVRSKVSSIFSDVLLQNSGNTYAW